MHSLPAAAPSSCASLKLRLLASAMEACGDDEETRYDTLRQRYELLQEYVLARPVRSWSDVIEIAEIVHFWAQDDRVAAALIVAVLEMAKGGENA